MQSLPQSTLEFYTIVTIQGASSAKQLILYESKCHNRKLLATVNKKKQEDVFIKIDDDRRKAVL